MMCLLTPNNYASYAVPVRQYQSLPFRFLQCIPHGKPPCDVLTVRDVTPACKGFAPSGNYFFSSNIVNLYAKIFTFGIFTDLRWWVNCSCRAHTHAYVHWLVDVHFGSFAPAFTLSLCDSERSRKPLMPIASVISRHPKTTILKINIRTKINIQNKLLRIKNIVNLKCVTELN